MPPSSDGASVIATQLKNVVLDEEHLELLNDAARRVHRITFAASELIALHLARCYRDGVAFPSVSATWIKSAMLDVSVLGSGLFPEAARRAADPEVMTTRQQCMADLSPGDRRGVDNMLMANAIGMAATFTTNLGRHFGARMRRFVRAHWPVAEGATKEQKKAWALEMLKVTADLCAMEGSARKSDASFHAWVDEWRERLRLRNLPSACIDEDAKKASEKLLYASCAVNEYFETRGQRCFACWPIRRHFCPGFINVDTKAIGELLHLDKGYENAKATECKERKAAQELRKAQRSSIGRPVILRPSHRRRHAAAVAWATADATAQDAARRLQAAWRSRQAPMRRWLAAQAAKHPNAIGRLKMLARAARRRARDARARNDRLRAQHKEDRWASVLTFGKSLKIPKKLCFAGSLRTDGVSVRLLFKPRCAGKRKRDASDDALPTTGLYAIEQLKHLSRQKRVEVIGADPGKRELLVCANVSADVPDDRVLKEMPTARLTSGERRHALRAERNARCSVDFSSLSSHNSKSAVLATLQGYFSARHELADVAFEAYSSPIHRKRRWAAHRAAQRSMTDFVRRIKSLRQSEDSTLILAYGSWSNCAGRPGAPCNRGHPPCIGIGLRRELSKHFLVAVTPEHWTSKTCCLCGHQCGACAEVDAERRDEKMARAESDEEQRRASRFSVRGLRRCTNAACAAFLNRDLNASINIGRRCVDALRGAVIEANDDEFARLRVDLNMT